MFDIEIITRLVRHFKYGEPVFTYGEHTTFRRAGVFLAKLFLFLGGAGIIMSLLPKESVGGVLIVYYIAVFIIWLVNRSKQKALYKAEKQLNAKKDKELAKLRKANDKNDESSADTRVIVIIIFVILVIIAILLSV